MIGSRIWLVWLRDSIALPGRVGVGPSANHHAVREVSRVGEGSRMGFPKPLRIGRLQEAHNRLCYDNSI
ncbi:hypothetical protein Isop_2762 [Isosphaera pallida ATCC 43644]|uniref:Uncharacterized protein n=1 Tax=Isosphaera pallida (strain ATCC 43644 / DSM 9630 / IS1B) TaxID=575540 RepID=E8R0J6_ISOPI|nr:hypothetical protein Isop_2762 [Isosphaera pallida ATCC 43644]